MKKILVTGGSGFIGSNLVKFLLKKKYFVINIDCLKYSANPYNTKNLNKNKNYVFFKLDINNKNKILKILKKPYNEQREMANYQTPSTSNKKYETFCGT